MSSPVVRTVKDLTVTIASLANTTLGTFTFPHPDSVVSPNRGTVVDLGLGSGHTPAEGGSNSLPPSQASDPATTDTEHHGGVFNASIVTAGLAAANVFLRAIRITDKAGNVLKTVYEDSAALPGILPTNASIVAGLLKNIPVLTGEGVRFEIYNNSGGAITNATVAGQFQLGINAQVADLSGQVPTI